MKQFKFITNLKSATSMEMLQSVLGRLDFVKNFEVDFNSKNKVLTIFGERICPLTVENALAEQGVDAEPVNKKLFYAIYEGF